MRRLVLASIGMHIPVPTPPFREVVSYGPVERDTFVLTLLALFSLVQRRSVYAGPFSATEFECADCEAARGSVI